MSMMFPQNSMVNPANLNAANSQQPGGPLLARNHSFNSIGSMGKKDSFLISMGKEEDTESFLDRLALEEKSNGNSEQQRKVNPASGSTNSLVLPQIELGNQVKNQSAENGMKSEKKINSVGRNIGAEGAAAQNMGNLKRKSCQDFKKTLPNINYEHLPIHQKMFGSYQSLLSRPESSNSIVDLQSIGKLLQQTKNNPAEQQQPGQNQGQNLFRVNSLAETLARSQFTGNNFGGALPYVAGNMFHQNFMMQQMAAQTQGMSPNPNFAGMKRKFQGGGFPKGKETKKEKLAAIIQGSGAVDHNGKRVGKWSTKEDLLLHQLASEYLSRGAKINFKALAERLEGRTAKQCREHWLSTLDPSLKKGRWTQSEEVKLLALMEKYGKCWSLISKEIPGRAEHSVKAKGRLLLGERLKSIPQGAVKFVENQETSNHLFMLHQRLGDKFEEISKNCGFIISPAKIERMMLDFCKCNYCIQFNNLVRQKEVGTNDKQDKWTKVKAAQLKEKFLVRFPNLKESSDANPVVEEQSSKAATAVQDSYAPLPNLKSSFKIEVPATSDPPQVNQVVNKFKFNTFSLSNLKSPADSVTKNEKEDEEDAEVQELQI
eukprot:snap_masked-scaffold_12-processed-gene-5.39-mRNA-1 protein AED:0.38 eAED:0.41 QI:0/-1/0/1/-1/1/1/0/599